MKRKQMVARLFLIVLLLSFPAGCARPPVAKLDNARNVVDHAYASGAARYAPGEYQLASSALLAAEQQVRNGDYRKAERTLELVRRYASEALDITLQYKKQLAREQQRQAEEKRSEELRKERERELELELQRQAELKKLEEEKQAQAKSAAVKPAVKPATAKKPPDKPVKPKPVNEVEVRAGENLAQIAARPEVYADALLWPLIYKANRDQIKDPQEIFAGQVFVVPRDKSRDDIEQAREEARTLNLF